MIGQLTKLVSGVVEAGQSVVGIRSGTEEPGYSVEQKLDGVEIRRYGPRIAAETSVSANEEAARSAGFRRLAGYIFGKNQGSTKIAMTAPVAQQAQGEKIAMTAPVAQTSGGEGSWVIRFFMPSDKTMDTLPEPNDSSVRLVEVPEETFAVLRFSGVASASDVAEHTAKLMGVLDDAPWQPTGTPTAWFYDPPWTVPFRRRNEIAVQVTAR
jgi:SOUL heme-binding protein